MKKIILFDPSYGTSNLGDFIINEAVMKQMDFVFSNNYLIRYSTHSPLMQFHQIFKKNFISRNCNKEYLKFLGGSNIFKHDLFRFTLDWNISLFTKHFYKNSVSIGCGVEGNPDTINLYTKHIYKSVLSKEHVHSVRDDKTKRFIESLGFQAINTGCPTLWDLNSEFCKVIPIKKSDNVVFTLTDYFKDKIKDQIIIDTLVKNYSKVYFWVQGTDDIEYFLTFRNTENIIILNPNIKAFKRILNQGKIDYVGTRLHAGIYAMQHKIRSIIITIDNRARDMHETYNINTIERAEVDKLSDLINSDFTTDIKINEANINIWKSQFIGYK